MSRSRVVLVTGVSRHLGGLFCRELSSRSEVERILAVDVVPPTHDLGRAQFVRADIRNPVIAKIIDRGKVDTVVHMAVLAAPSSGGRTSMKEVNVIGSMQLMAACGKSHHVRRLVVKSTAAVYGGSSRDPACFTEEDVAKSVPRSGWGADSVEVEGYVRGFSRRRPDVEVAVLRFANALGPGLRTEVSDYFSLPIAPSVLGFDPRLHFVHTEDLTAAMIAATLGRATGSINVAGDGVITLAQALGMTGRPRLPVPHGRVEPLTRRLGRVMGAQLGPDLMRLLTYGRVLDTTRMREDLHFEPKFTTRQTFSSEIAPNPVLDPSELAPLTNRLRSTAGLLDSLLGGGKVGVR